jgi:hypothetical protein
MTAPILVWSLALVAGVIAMALDSMRARRRYRIAPGDPTHPDAVLCVARSLRRTGITVVVMGALAIAILMLLRLDDAQRVWLSGTPLFMIAIGIGVGLRAHRVTRLLDRAHAIALTAGERYVFIVLDDELKTWLRASPALLMRAASMEIPVARIRS